MVGENATTVPRKAWGIRKPMSNGPDDSLSLDETPIASPMYDRFS